PRPSRARHAGHHSGLPRAPPRRLPDGRDQGARGRPPRAVTSRTMPTPGPTEAPRGPRGARLQAPVGDAPVDLVRIERALYVDDDAPVAHERQELRLPEVEVLLVRDREDEAVELRELVERRELQPVLVHGLRRVRERIVDDRVDAERAKLL